jgi:MATE family, multidrug efflux pump
VSTPASPLAGPAARRPAPSLRMLLALAWPIVVSRSSQVVVGVSDAALVHHLGEAALAATTTGALNTLTLLILPMGVVFIVSSFSSQLFGAGNAQGARRYGFYGLGVALGAQVVAMAALPSIPWVLGHFDYSAEVRRLMADYLVIRLLSAGPAVGIEALANYYGGLGRTRLPMVASVAAMVLNVAGNWLLIDGHLGLPAMGVRGSALASAVSTSVAFAALLAVFLADRPRDAHGRRAPWLPPLSLSELANMLRFGLPSGLNWFLEFLAYSFFINVVVTGLGTTALAAMMTVMQVNSVSFMPAFGIASAGAILVGQAIGAGHKDEVPLAVRVTLRAAASWQCAVGLLYLIAPRQLLAPFVDHADSAAALYDAGARMLMLSAAWQVFDAAVGTFAEALRAAGDTTFTLWVRVAVAWILFGPGSWISVRVLHGGELVAVMWLVIYMALLAFILWLRFRGGAWRRIRLVGHQPG